MGGRKGHCFPPYAEKSFCLTNVCWGTSSGTGFGPGNMSHFPLCQFKPDLLFVTVCECWGKGHTQMLLNSLYCKAFEINNNKNHSRILEIHQIIIRKAMGSPDRLRHTFHGSETVPRLETKASLPLFSIQNILCSTSMLCSAWC